jgi:protease YdgD
MFRLIGALICLAIAWSAAPAFAQQDEQGTAPRRLLKAYEQLKWKGIGRLNTGAYEAWAGNSGAYGYCTATLISEILALTAAHCLFDENRQRRNDTELYFAAGWRNGEYQSIRQASRTAVHPDYVPGGPKSSLEQIVADVALVELDAPVLTSEIPNYTTETAMPDIGEPVTLLSYGKGRDNALSKQEPCRIKDRRHGFALLSCEVAPGSSGSPVFTQAHGAPKMVAVISAYSAQGSYAVVLEDVMPALKEELAGKSAVRKVLSTFDRDSVGTGVGTLPQGGAWAAIKPPKN